jgi:septum formation protein
MLIKWLNFLNNQNIIFATGSISRINLLKEMGLKFESKTSDFPEDLEKTNAKDYVEKTSLRKFEEFLDKNQDLNLDILITADTIIEHEGKILEKPQDENEIYKWLSSYSNSLVVCYTSVVIGIIRKSENSEGLIKNEVYKSVQFTNSTIIFFDQITKEMISYYINTGEPFNRAGGFAIQGLGRLFIKKIEGCFYNVIGFPIHEFGSKFSKLLEDTFGDVNINNI